MKGSLCHELETGLPAADVWEVYGSLLLGQLVTQLLPDILSKVEVVDGDGGVGTVLLFTFPPGIVGLSCQKEKFIKVDHENFVKEAVVVEGGFLDLGFLSYLLRFEIIDAGEGSIIRSTVEYEVGDDGADTASLASTSILACVAETITKHIKVQKSTERTTKQAS
uniref:Uncharacterized protein n=1 Tax=Avena sativa TaxID=4498 RepID=A0ACD5YTQ3_AVESA